MNYYNLLNHNARDIKPSGIRKFFDIVQEMPDAISLGVGEPDFITPWQICNEAIKSIKSGHTQYTSNPGILKLRELISQYLFTRYNLSYETSEIIVTVGASESIDLALRAMINAGDEVLIPEPSYVSYLPCVTLCGGIPVPLSCSASNSFKITRESLLAAITPKTKAIILPYPNNPTGAIMTREELEEIASELRNREIFVISDEIYSELTYGRSHTSIADLEGMRDKTIVINGFSKSFAMTGWRLGYLAGPKEVVSVMLKIHQYTIMCASSASQYAGIAALTNGFSDNFSIVSQMREQYNMRRRFLVSELNAMGLECFMPEGAFYVFPSVLSTGMDGDAFASALLTKQKVAVIPGSAFGESGRNHIRISYAYSIKQLEEAMRRIKEFLAANRQLK